MDELILNSPEWRGAETERDLGLGFVPDHEPDGVDAGDLARAMGRSEDPTLRGAADAVPPTAHPVVDERAATGPAVPPGRAPRRRRFVPTKQELSVAAASTAVVVTLLVAVGGRAPSTPRVTSSSASATTTDRPSTVPDAPTSSTDSTEAPVVPTMLLAPTTTVTSTSGGPPTSALASPTTGAVTSTTVVPDITALARTCTRLPSGDPGMFTPTAVGTGRDPDPRTKVMSRWIAIGFGKDLGPIDQRPPYTVVGELTLPGVADPKTGSPIDRLGSVQTWYSWDGAASHKGIRRWDGTRWTMSLDGHADDLTVAAEASSVAFFWNEIQPGWRYAMFVATAAAVRGA